MGSRFGACIWSHEPREFRKRGKAPHSKSWREIRERPFRNQHVGAQLPRLLTSSPTMRFMRAPICLGTGLGTMNAEGISDFRFEISEEEEETVRGVHCDLEPSVIEGARKWGNTPHSKR